MEKRNEESHYIVTITFTPKLSWILLTLTIEARVDDGRDNSTSKRT